MSPANYFIILVPGYMGSKLRDKRTGEIVWLDLPGLLRDPFRIDDNLKRLFETLRYPNDNLEPAGIIEDVVFLPPLFKAEQYSRLIEALQSYGCSQPDRPAAGKIPLYTFAYDWRQDNRISARQLAARVDEWRKRHNGAKAWLIGHSNGGIVARWYIEKEGGKENVARLLLMASPRDGAPQAVRVLMDGLNVFLTRLFSAGLDINALTRQAVLSFPSFYQIVPHHFTFLSDETGRKIDIHKDLGWLENDRQRQMLLDALKFNQDLGDALSVDTLCFIGDKQMTTSRGVVQKTADGKWQKIAWQQTERGDGTVPLPSATHPNAKEKLPYLATHGDIYIVPPVLEKLAFEINPPPFPSPMGITAVSGGLKITFEPQQDAVDPGGSLGVWATVAIAADEQPLSGANVTVRMEMIQALPTALFPPTPSPVEITLLESRQAGRYIGALTAPAIQGYYRLVCTIQAGPGAPVTVEELVLVDSAAPAPQPPLAGAFGDQSGWGRPSSSRPESKEVFRSWDPNQEATPKGIAGDGPVFRSWEPTPPPLQGGPVGAPQPLAAAPPPEQPAGRFINAEFTEHDMNEPLPLDRESTLALYIDTQAGQFIPEIRFDDQRIFQGDETVVQLEVYLTSRDFIVHTKGAQILRLPKGAVPSRNKVRFDIEPRQKQPGVGEATALIFKDKNFVQGVTLKLNVGAGDKAIAGVEALGRPPDSVIALQPRDVTLFIKKAVDGYDLTLVREAVTEARLPISALELNQMVKEARKALLDVVHLKAGSSLPYQQPVMTIPEDISWQALKSLARAGWKLYRSIFFGPRAGADANLLGERLRQLAEGGQLKLQIISQDFMLPWGLLYLAKEVTADTLDAERFLGLKHIIEHIPLQTNMPVFDNTISSQPRLTVSLNVDTSVDRQGVRVVGDQLEWWQKLAAEARLNVVERKSGGEFVQALATETTPDQIIYFYGHAVSKQLEEDAGPGSSSLSFAGSKITLDDLFFDAPTTRPLNSNPLVFINACEGAELSPLFYGGFMPYFTQKGARGMIGAECEVPGYFAVEFARRFFERFLFEEKTVGEVFLELRREFYHDHRNILGLIYALYCDGDTRVRPGV